MRILSFITIFSFLSYSCQQSGDTEENPPNVVFILVDDLGYKDLGVYGSTFYDTPHLDSLAGVSTRFTNAYAASPVCSPTRAALMTGKDPVRVNITDWIPGHKLEYVDNPNLVPPEDIHNLPLSEITLAEAFKDHGYKTFYAGKWHLGETADYWPQQQGFDINKGGHHKGSPPGGYYSPYKNPRLENGPEGEYLTDRLTDESIQFIENNQDSSFFLYLAFYTVHTPIQGCEKYDAYYQQKKKQLPNQGEVKILQDGRLTTRINQSDAKYAAMVRSMDENVGRLLRKLNDLRLAENTIIVFTSDNGGLTARGSNPGPTAVYPLRAGKGWLYEGGVRVPLIIKTPGQQIGQITEQPAISMDLFPTVLQLAGLPRLPEQPQDGQSLMPYLKEPAQVDERTLVWHYPHYHGTTWRPGSAIRQGDWKLIEFYEKDTVELYNLKDDEGENINRSIELPEKAKELRGLMHEYIKARNGNYPLDL
ncbi:MAG: sulfatase [Candidatus Cyclobacteriaceae bacterium M3_2C_046]